MWKDMTPRKKEYTNDGKWYLGKDFVTEWYKDLTDINHTRTGLEPVLLVLRLLGLKGETHNVRSPLEALSLFLPDSEIEKIMQYTTSG